MARGMQVKRDVEWRLEKSKSRKVTRKKKGRPRRILDTQRTRREGWTNNGYGARTTSGLVVTRTKINQDRCGNAIPREGETGARRQEARQHAGTQVVPKGNSEGNGRNGWSTFQRQRKRQKRGTMDLRDLEHLDGPDSTGANCGNDRTAIEERK